MKLESEHGMRIDVWMAGVVCATAVGLAGVAIAAPPSVPVLTPEGPRVAGVQPLAFDAKEYEALRGLDEFILPDVLLSDGSAVSLRLSRFEVLAPDAVIVAADEHGEHPLPRPDVQLFEGEVAEIPGSRVFLGLSPWGTSGYLQMPQGVSIISSGPMGAMPTVIYDTFGPSAANVRVDIPRCAGGIEPPEGGQPPAAPGGYGDRASVCRALRLAVDCDYEFTYSVFGGLQGSSSAYVTVLVGASSSIYRADVNAGFQLAYLRLWTTTEDPYTSTTTGNQLPQFRSYWNSNMGSVQRDLAHLVSGRNLGGGIAYKPGLCSSNAYAVSANMNGFFPYPVQHNKPQNWDLMVVTHEIGHNLNSGHTHDPNSYTPPIDGCGNAYLNPPLPQDCTVADARQGTVMSYCHLCSLGMASMRMEFGPRPTGVIRSYIDQRSTCGISPTVTITQQPQSRQACAGDEVTFTVNATGTGTRVYQWRRNGINLAQGNSTSMVVAASAATAGTYDCVVTATCVTAISSPATLTVLDCPCDPDVNQDGNVDQDDVIYLINVVGGGNNSTGIDPDFNRDGNIDQDDVTALINAVGGGGCP
jgi:hypothetical protein